MIQQFHSWVLVKKTLIQKDICTPMFIVAMTWKHPIIHSSQDMEAPQVSINR